jgi:hypothetical protein
VPAAALARLRRRLGRAPLVLAPRDRRWRDIAPPWADCLALIRSGLPFHVVAERRYDRTARPARLGPALARGATVYAPQAHEVLPRVARLMVAIRADLLGARREACSFLFLVDGRGREGMGLHHDGPVDAFWLQLEGRRRVTVGPRVARGTPEDLDTGRAVRGGPGWRTFDLGPGTLFHLPPFVPHRVICPGRSLALSLTWSPAPRRLAGRARLAALAAWPVVSGRATAIPPSGRRLWPQVPAVAAGGRGPVTLVTAWGRIALPASARALTGALAAMASLDRAALRGPHRTALERLLAHGVLDARDLPVAIRPADPSALDGWRFG